MVQERLRGLATCLVGLVSYIASAQETETARPAALERAVAARSAELLKTVRLEYVRHDRDPNHRFGPHSYFHSWSAAGDERVATAWGDEEGVCLRNERGEPGIEYSEIGPQSTLFSHGEIWQHRDDSTRAVVNTEPRVLNFLPTAEQFFDLRLLGIDPFGADRNIEDHVRDYGEGPLRYESHPEGKLVVVTATTTSGARFTWWIDPDRDYSVTQTATEHDGKRLVEAHYELAQFDGIWFPKRIDRYRVGAGEHVGAEASETLEFLTVEFNHPEHPKHFSPTDIGIEAGVSVIFHDARKPGAWDGHAVVPTDDFMARVAAGELTRGPNVLRVMRRRQIAAGMQPTAETESVAASSASQPADAGALGGRGFAGAAQRLRNGCESEWERYTRRFIQRFALDAAQTERATGILRDCQERAAKLSADRKDTFDDLTARMRKDESRPKATEQMSRELRELRGALDRIFEEQLKPRLEKLPTRAQRDAAHEPAASQPAAK